MRIIHYWCPECQNTGFNPYSPNGYCSCPIGYEMRNRWNRFDTPYEPYRPYPGNPVRPRRYRTWIWNNSKPPEIRDRSFGPLERGRVEPDELHSLS